jgi:signal transduction histidine kinase
MKRLMPDSLRGWVFTVLLSVVILINVTALVVYFVFRDEIASAAAASQAADQIIAIKQLVESAPAGDQLELIERLSSPSSQILLTQRPMVRESDDQRSSRVVLRKLRREFPSDTDIRVDSRISPQGFPSGWPEESGADLSQDVPQGGIDQLLALGDGIFGPSDQALFTVSVGVDDDTWVNARVRLNVDDPPSQFPALLWLTIISVVIGGVALWGVRLATGPLSVFASAAERLGVDVNAEPLRESGPSEVRRAARAFNTMQTRVKRFIQDRTHMLAAISHDLRTPITRLRLRAEFVEDDQERGRMLNDLAEMEAMISATLAFARDDAANESVSYIDVAAVLASLCADQATAGHDVTYSGPDSFELVARPIALKRAVNNIVDNAVKYGKRAHLKFQPSTDEICILVDDEGPGIGKNDRERVFEPFTRLESSRSRETGGTGLGLTISRNAIRSMGGDLELMDSPEGGLRVKIVLPIAGAELLAAQ